MKSLATSRPPRWLPPWPVVPPLLWATAAVAVLAVLSLVFKHELWTRPGRAGSGSAAVLLGALVVAGPQVARVLWNWPAAYAGPRWLGILFEVGTRAAAVGLLVLELLGCLVLAGLMLLGG
ncbi:hypothetical protein [Hymenobacter nivis]|uniref:Uncharacterized protein n=1 Tax=Hymenobacter nivis TaxID=1850093 RepID=A0A502GY42_9BACT|nr:hypothetical protein [Hymenobacter nivis]TPG67327.1 hypothetical protein EAH73_06280 [Hymenobacter nivis]